jgi:hypothetical protein
MVSEVGEGMAEGRQFPVEHGKHARLGQVEDHVVAAIVAVDDARFGIRTGRRDVARKPFDQPVHRLDPPGLDVAEILLRPAADLSLEIVSGLAVVAEARRLRIDLVKPGDGRVHRVEIGRAVIVRDLREIGLPEDPPFDHLHYVKGRSDHLLVHAQAISMGHRKALRAERADHPIFPVDGMGARKQLARRLASKHVGAGRSDQLVGRVGLAALELLDPQRASESRDVRLHPLLEPSDIETMRVADLDCAAILCASIHRLTFSCRGGELKAYDRPGLVPCRPPPEHRERCIHGG